jgi:hypothetical protein
MASVVGDFSERNVLVPDSVQLVEQVIAGAGVTVTPAAGTGIITITATGSGGVASVSAGPGISLAGTTTNPIVTNNGVRTLTPIIGGGITLGGSTNNPTIEVSGTRNVVGGTGIIVTGTNTQTVANDGVLTAVAGTGISVSAPKGNVTFTNTGVTQITAGSGVTISPIGGTGNVTINNGGVTQNIGGTGISVSPVGGTGAVTINNTGIITAGAGPGLTNTGTATNPVFEVSGTRNVVGGTGITVSGTTTQTVTNSGVLTVAGGTGITSSGGQNPTITNTGVTRVIAGAGVSISPVGGTGNVTINATGTGVTLPTPTTHQIINAGVRTDLGVSPSNQFPNTASTGWGTITGWKWANIISGGQPYSNCKAVMVTIHGDQPSLNGIPNYAWKYAYSGGGMGNSIDWYVTDADLGYSGGTPALNNLIYYLARDQTPFFWDPSFPLANQIQLAPLSGPSLALPNGTNMFIAYPQAYPDLFLTLFWTSNQSGGMIGFNQSITNIWIELTPLF